MMWCFLDNGDICVWVTNCEETYMKNKFFTGMIGLLVGFISGGISITKLFEKKILNKEKEIYKNKSYYDMSRKWVEAYQNNKRLADYLKTKGYNRVAIYGMGDIGVLLYKELMNTNVNVLYGIDKSTIGRGFDLKIVAPSPEMEEVDVIIVTALFAFDEISEMLSDMVSYKIEALDDLIYEMC